MLSGTRRRLTLPYMCRLRRWEDLPEFMRLPEVRPYWDILYGKRFQITLKRVFDLAVSLVLFLILLIPMAVIAVIIRLDSPGPVFFRQERVTAYGSIFRIHKFRSMISGADRAGPSVTAGGDPRITRVGKKLRKYRLDELPQLLDVISGAMSIVGTRPEVPRYVGSYKPEFYATLLLPAGITSEASIRYKDEESLLENAEDADRVYTEDIIPAKMVWNLESIRRFRFLREILTMIRTALAMCGMDFK